MDGELLELLRAVGSVDEVALRRSLASDHRFDVDPDGASIVWKGREMTGAESTQALARLRKSGVEVDEQDGPRHWLRGTLTVANAASLST